jgi:hypothetical protein
MFLRRFVFFVFGFTLLLTTSVSPRKVAVTASADALAAPNATITEIRPIDNGVLLFEPLAPATASDSRQAQLSIDVVVRNNQGTTINIDKVQLSYSGGPQPVPPTVVLSSKLKKKCEGEANTVDVATDPAIDPGQACRLILLPDPKIPVPAPAQVNIDVYFQGFTSPITATRSLMAHRNAPPAGSYFYPAKADDLDDGEFWSGQSSGAGSHHRTDIDEFYAYDVGVVRYDSNSSAWTNLHPNTSGQNNTDYLCWGKPIYAMADGVVLGFADGNTDNVPGDKSNPPNFFTIQHGNEVGRYYHLQKGSLNASLKQVGATVKAGQFLGRTGNSGNSSAPHLHVDITANGAARPVLFHDIFLVERASLSDPTDPFAGDWTPVQRQGLPWEKVIIWPAPFLRRGTGASVPVDLVAMTQASPARAVTAARDGSGNLLLSTWDVTESGEVEHQANASAGPVSRVAIENPGYSSEVVTAVRDGNGTLKLIVWDILTATGGFVRKGEAEAGPVSEIAMSGLPTGGLGVITAVRSGDGTLKLIAWEVTAGSLQIVRKGDASGSAITHVAITEVRNPLTAVVTASRGSDGNLKLTAWQVTTDKTFIKKGEAVAGPISAVAATTVRVSAAKEFVLTAVRDKDGYLEVIAWEVLPSGQIVRRGEGVAGLVSEVAINTMGNFEAVTTVRDENGALKLIAWEVTPSGLINRKGDAAAGAVSKVAMTGMFVSDQKQYTVPALRDSQGKLRLIAWETNLTP